MASLSRSLVLCGQSVQVGPGEPHKTGLAKAIHAALLTLDGAYSPQLLNLPDVVLDQSTNGFVAVA